MRKGLFSREGGSPSANGLAGEISGDGPLPAQGHCQFSVSAQKLSGMMCAVLGWTPEQFWDATPAELAAIFAVFPDNAPGHPGQTPLSIEQLEKLKEVFPDG